MTPEPMWSLAAAADAVEGHLAGPDAAFFSVGSDTRAMRPGDLFVALVGPNFDAARFARAALQGGAAGVMVNRDADTDLEPAIRVADTRLALGRLAAAWRARFSMPVAAITGSNGKTTVKEMLAAILRERVAPAQAVLATEGNLNNDIGLPLTLLRLRATHRFAVLEMGMNHAGELAYLTGLARPDVALVNNAQAAHVGLLGSLEAVAAAKAEIFEGLGPTGTAVINADDAHAGLWRELNRARAVVDFSLGGTAAVSGRLAPDGVLRIDTPLGATEIRLAVAGEHNARNALAATACALSMGAGLAAIKAGLQGFHGVPGRLQRKCALHGACFIDDSYNANPDSTRAALAVLACANGPRILVLGDMGELGEDAPALHADIGLAAKQAGVARLFALGELSAEAVRAFGAGGMHYARIEELLADLENALAPGVTVLVKGSRFMKMERVADSFTHDVEQGDEPCC
jgi:UDP-N-acetylmuramoyl-tripeptide--D-alanyl-D-alanine ligase